MIKFGLIGRDKLQGAPDPPPEPPDEMPTLVTSREGENCDAVFYGNIIELKPRLYDSSGLAQVFWSYNAGFRNVVPGETYEIRAPRANCISSSMSRAHVMVSHDGLDPNDLDKIWLPFKSGSFSQTYRHWNITAQSTTLDISQGLPATWTMLDQKLFRDWVAHSYDTLASTGPGFEIARTQQEVDQQGLVVPEQIQRLWHMGNPNADREFVFVSGVHSCEHVGSRGWMHGIDLLLAEYPDILDAFRFTCTHTVTPGRYRGHANGWAVIPGGSPNTNRTWTLRDERTPFVTTVEDAIRTALGGQIDIDYLIDCHGYWWGTPEYRYEDGYSSDPYNYIDAAAPGVWDLRRRRAVNGMRHAALTHWGARAAGVLEWGDARCDTDEEIIGHMRGFWDGIQAALDDGFFSTGVVNGMDPELIFDNRDPGVVRVGDWHESSRQPEYRDSSEFCGPRGAPCNGYLQWPAAASGEHHVDVWWTWGANRTNQAIYEVDHADGTARVTVDQSNESNAGNWFRIGTFTDPSAVRVRSDVGQVSADAVRLTPTGNDSPCECVQLIDDIEQLQVMAVALLHETNSPIAAEMVDILGGLRVQLGS